MAKRVSEPVLTKGFSWQSDCMLQVSPQPRKLQQLCPFEALLPSFIVIGLGWLLTTRPFLLHFASKAPQVKHPYTWAV